MALVQNIKNDFGLTGRRILVAGGTRGLGRAISLRLARAGAAVFANYVRNEEAAEEMRRIVQEQGLDMEILRADLTGPKGMNVLLSSIRQWLEPDALHALVFCAATGVHKTLDHLGTREFDWTFSLNVRAYFDLTTRLIPNLTSGSSIVAISSPGARRAGTTYSLVGASKGAMDALTRHLAVELGPRGIRANVVSPGVFQTDVWKSLPDAEERLSRARDESPLRRLVTADEVAACVQFLCADAASGITGGTLIVDGGEGVPYPS